MFRMWRPFWNDKPADLRAAVPYLHFLFWQNPHPELPQYRMRFTHTTRAEYRIFVPIGRQTQHWPWIARAEGADDQVMHRLAVGHGLHMLAFCASHPRESKFGDSLRRIVQQALFI